MHTNLRQRILSAITFASIASALGLVAWAFGSAMNRTCANHLIAIEKCSGNCKVTVEDLAKAERCRR